MAIARSRRSDGVLLGDQLLSPALGEADTTWLHCPVHGSLPSKLRDDTTPLVLSFGFDIAGGLQSMLRSGGVSGHQVCAVAALFNLGISYFDLLCDTDEKNIAVIGRYLSRSSLQELMDNMDAGLALTKTASNVADTGVRILLKIIGTFFQALHSDASMLEPISHANLKDLIGGAYDAQMRASLWGSQPQEALPSLSRLKSTLPFLIIGQLASGSSYDQGPGMKIAEVFWKLDDLVDLTEDLAGGNINAILLSRSSNYFQADPVEKIALAEQYAEGPELSIAIGDLALRLDNIYRCCGDAASVPGCIYPFGEVLLHYIRSWIPNRLLKYYETY
jgi:hypothetical protein